MTTGIEMKQNNLKGMDTRQIERQYGPPPAGLQLELVQVVSFMTTS